MAGLATRADLGAGPNVRHYSNLHVFGVGSADFQPAREGLQKKGLPHSCFRD